MAHQTARLARDSNLEVVASLAMAGTLLVGLLNAVLLIDLL